MSKFIFNITKRGYHSQYEYNQEFEAENIEAAVKFVASQWSMGSFFSGELIGGGSIKEVGGTTSAYCSCPFTCSPYGFGGWYDHSRMGDANNWEISK